MILDDNMSIYLLILYWCYDIYYYDSFKGDNGDFDDCVESANMFELEPRLTFNDFLLDWCFNNADIVEEDEFFVNNNYKCARIINNL